MQIERVWNDRHELEKEKKECVRHATEDEFAWATGIGELAQLIIVHFWAATEGQAGCQFTVTL